MGLLARASWLLPLLFVAGSCSALGLGDEPACKLDEGCVYGECDVLYDEPGPYELCVDPHTGKSYVRACVAGEFTGGYTCRTPDWTPDAGLDGGFDAAPDGG